MVDNGADRSTASPARQIRGAVLETIGAAAPYRQSQPITISELTLDPPEGDEILIRIEAAGVCHSDLSVVNGNRPRPVPMLLGHEAAGIIEELGPDVHDLSVGQRVVLTFLPRCGDCAGCRSEGQTPCVTGTASNNAGTLITGGQRLHRDGETVKHHLGVSGFASHAVVSRRSVVAVGNDIPAPVAAILGCAMLTGGGAVLNVVKPSPETSIAIVGLGGVGMAALLAAKALGVKSITGIDTQTSKLETALTLGATAAHSTEDLSQLGLKFDAVIEAAGHPRALETAIALTAPGGITVTVGLPAPGQSITVDPLTLTAEARTIRGSYLGSAVPEHDIPIYEQLWREGKLPVESLVSATIPLENINEAMDKLADGQTVRQLITFDEKNER